MDKSTEQMLIDRFAIIDLFNRYATGADKRDSALYRSCFTDEINLNVTGATTSTEKRTADAWVEQAIGGLGFFERTQHMISNHIININGDQADAIAYLQAQHFNKGSRWTVWGTYSNQLTRTSDGWKISSLALSFDWQENG
jgi:3-phenylpropionate/cinnamic acid dioxygenase small subunit